MKLLDKYLVAIMTILGSIMILYHMVYTQPVLLEPTQHQNLHIMFALSHVLQQGKECFAENNCSLPACSVHIFNILYFY